MRWSSITSNLFLDGGHDSGQIIHTPAFKSISKPSMTLASPEGALQDSNLLLHHATLADDGLDCLPELRWTAPQCDQPVQEYVLICEDIEPPIPFHIIHLGLQWKIPLSASKASPAEVKPSEADSKRAGAVSNSLGASYIRAGPPLGHDTHRYVYTIIALSERLQFEHPTKASKKDIQNAMVGKLVGWGQWIGVFKSPWPN
ncbi:uncharacterized protein N7477_005217 [Penicillium maclennaniae]|uniref:uncharacterized protein n=1 Tax=Penicillium maclennaniae TaxID=1343394 RepID=UPI0025403446|nr:uncharacterized protein N7477_005217 [Penicillium maclennaniae]KAJ5675283.1 hypothetical protein N7477_005217 [Penicillium maclennaniae]